MPWDQQHYETLRLELIDRNEARVDNVYLDTLGIPTIGFGVALTARQRDRSMRIDEEHVDSLVDVLNLDQAHRERLNALLADYVRVQNRHVDERFRNLVNFQGSQFGREAEEVLGPAVNTRHNGPNGIFYSWDILTNEQSPLRLTLTHEQSLELFQEIAPDYENRLDRILGRANCPPEALSEEQRAALYSMTYHGAAGKARRVAEPIGQYWRGEISEEQLQAQLQRAVHDPQFPQRSANELELLQTIERRPAPELQTEEQPLQQHGNASLPDTRDAQTLGDLQHLNADERRRMIEDDRPRNNDIHFGAPVDREHDVQNLPGHDPQSSSTGDPDLDRLAAALYAGDDAAITQAATQIAQSDSMQAFARWGHDLLAWQQQQDRQQELDRQAQQTDQGYAR